ncbi:MAG: cyclic peptide export ABC transporter [Cyanobacteria bacterium P01_F01_bin.153]
MEIIQFLLKISWVNIVIAIVAGVVSGGVSARLIALINTAIAQGSSTISLIDFIVLTFLALTANCVSQFVLVDLAQDAVYQLRLQLSRQILAAPLRQLEELGPNRLLAVLTKDIDSIANLVSALPFICVELAVVAGCLVYLGYLSGWLLVVVVGFVLVAIALIQVLLRYAYRYLAESRQEVDRLIGHFQSIVNGIKELKLNRIRQQQFFDADLTASAVASRQYRKRAMKWASIATGTGKLLFFILMGALLFGVPSFLPEAVPNLSAYVLTLTYLIGPLDSLVGSLPRLADSDVSLRKVKQTGLNLDRNAERFATTQPPDATWQRLELAQVKYAYSREGGEENEKSEGDKKGGELKYGFGIGPIDMTVKAGELIFLVGGNGSGKSTLAKVLTGLYVPDSGEVRLDGVAIADESRDAYRQLFSTVFADFYLFERLTGAAAHTLEQQAQDYLTQLELNNKVSIRDGKLSTTALSQGQRKRLALLAAYLEDRPIYLFDEWAADQDPLFREIFYTQILKELKRRGKTVFVISHDDRYFHLCDRLIKLHYGKIEEFS